MAAPLKDIDSEQVEALAARFWNNVEIAAFFKVDEATIRRRFAEQVARGKSLGRGKLRDAQLAAAFKGSAAMLIFLGKQYLDQSDKTEIIDPRLVDNEIEFSDVPKNGDGKNRFSKYLNK